MSKICNLFAPKLFNNLILLGLVFIKACSVFIIVIIIETNIAIKIIDLILNPTKPELCLDSSVDDFFKFDNSKELKHVKVKNYKSMGKIDFPLAQ